MKEVVLRFRASDRAIFEAILNGQKTIETRAATKKYNQITAGDTLVLVCGEDRASKNITRVEHFESLKDLFRTFNFKTILPQAKSTEEASKIILSFPGYKEKIKAHGIMALVLEP